MTDGSPLEKIWYNSKIIKTNEWQIFHRRNNMSSLMVYNFGNKAVMMSDSRNITWNRRVDFNFDNYKVRDDEQKIFTYPNTLIGITGRVSFFMNNKEVRFSDLITNPDPFEIAAAINSIKDQFLRNEGLSVVVVKAEKEEITVTEVSYCRINETGIINPKEISNPIFLSGVLHCANSRIGDFYKTKADISRIIANIIIDENTEIALNGKTAGVGGKLQAYEINIAGDIVNFSEPGAPCVNSIKRDERKSYLFSKQIEDIKAEIKYLSTKNDDN